MLHFEYFFYLLIEKIVFKLIEKRHNQTFLNISPKFIKILLYNLFMILLKYIRLFFNKVFLCQLILVKIDIHELSLLKICHLSFQ